MIQRIRARPGGFTRLESLVTLIIVAVLIAVVATRYKNAKRAAFKAQMRAELFNLVTAQEAFYHTSGLKGSGVRYGDSLEELAFVPHRNVVIQLRGAAAGWAARAESIELPEDEYHCSIYFGDIEPYSPSAAEGVMECEPDEP